MKRLLITGARGFIGRHCLQPALKADFEVHGTISPGSVVDDNLSKLPVKWHKSNLLEPGASEQLVAEIRPSHILHAAWTTSHGDYWSSIENLAWINTSLELINAFCRHNGERFVTIGSCAEYDWASGFFSEKTSPDKPATLYGEAKLAVSRVLMASAATHGFSAANGRIFFAYGPYENKKRIIPYACQRLAQRKAANFSSGLLYRDFMHVSDIGRGMVALLQSELEGVCNVSSSTPIRLADIVETIGELSGQADLIKMGAIAGRPEEPPMLVGDNRKLLSTGWTPVTSLKEGLANTYAWWQENV